MSKENWLGCTCAIVLCGGGVFPHPIRFLASTCNLVFLFSSPPAFCYGIAVPSSPFVLSPIPVFPFAVGNGRKDGGVEQKSLQKPLPPVASFFKREADSRSCSSHTYRDAKISA